MTDGGVGLQAAVPVVLRFPLGALASVVATVAMDAATVRLPEGATPPAVSAAVCWAVLAALVAAGSTLL